ncbi:LysR substrate-binding domain-containing protein [Pseudarthrobacter sp. O4]|uniref:LysR substrate-binding domain-containing protein n=1 Tax=Pseudarthrobacter sp. O4 TaxID=3418417 RepID=UPI003CE855B9
MELRHLRYFVAVAELLHFGQAAERLHMAQPPLSQQIRALEAEIGVELLARTTRNVSLTPAGAVFYDDALRILKSVDEAVDRVKRFGDGQLGGLRVGFTGSASYRQLPEFVRIVKAEMPGVSLDIHTEMLTPEQEEALANSELDVAFLRPPTRTPGISSRLVGREPLVLIVSAQHRLSRRESVSMAELRDEGFIMYPAGSGSVVNDAVVHACLKAGFVVRREHEATKTSTVLSLVAGGLGVALVPDSVRSFRLDGVAFVAVDDAPMIDLALAWRENDPLPLLARLLEVLASSNVFMSNHSIGETA